MDAETAMQLGRLATACEQLVRQGADIELRLRRLERFQFAVVGGAVVISAAASALFRLL